MVCINCLRGFHTICYNMQVICCCSIGGVYNEGASVTEVTEVTDAPEAPTPTPPVGPKKPRKHKRDDALVDQQSTGRKRAARLYPLNRSAVCEWQGKKNMGGGPKPIEGCADGKQQARHHGPDKNTLNNEEGNVHRICHTCHNRWHAANDPNYDPNQPLKD